MTVAQPISLQPLLRLGLPPKSSHPREQDIHIYPVKFLSAQSFSEKLMNRVLPAETVMLLWTSTVVASFFVYQFLIF